MSITENEVFDFCHRARLAGFAITAFTPEELLGLDPFEVTDALVAAGNTYITEIAAPRFVARFCPQVWLGDQALEVSPEGADEWDVTEAFDALDADYRQAMLGEMGDDDETLDIDDLLKHDSNAPEWVRNWSGPFSLYVRHA